MSAAAHSVEAWNHAVPSGSPVALKEDDGRRVETRTRSAAWCASGVAVVLVEGRRGGYSLSRLEPIEMEDEEVVPMKRISMFMALALTGFLTLLLAIVALFSPEASRRSIVWILSDVQPGSWLDELRSRVAC